MKRATRRNITITDEAIDDYLDQKVSNVSAFIQDALRSYILVQETEYATSKEVAEIKKEVEILNDNYLQTKDVLMKISKVLFKTD